MAKRTKQSELQPIDESNDVSFEQPKLYTLHPWDVQHHAEHSEIEAYNELTDDWEILAVTKGNNHTAIAYFLTSIANDRNQNPNLFEEAVKALELCLENKTLTWAAEQAADVVVRKARQRFG